jgi:toxin-antitoxin system PIN domain toxin
VDSKALDILDVNIWLALAHADHVHHARALQYWTDESAHVIGYTRLTMLAVVRLSTNNHAMAGNPLSTSEAWLAYKSLCSEPGVEMIPEPIGLESKMQDLINRPEMSNALWTDTCLAAWAISSGARFVTFDTGFQKFRGLKLLLLQG